MSRPTPLAFAREVIREMYKSGTLLHCPLETQRKRVRIRLKEPYPEGVNHLDGVWKDSELDEILEECARVCVVDRHRPQKEAKTLDQMEEWEREGTPFASEIHLAESERLIAAWMEEVFQARPQRLP